MSKDSRRISRQSKVRIQSKPSYFHWHILSVLVIIALGISFLPSKQKAVEAPAVTPVNEVDGGINFKFNSQEALNLAKEMLPDTDNYGDKDAYLPQFAKERIDWFYGEQKKGSLDFRFEISREFQEQGKVGASMMSADYFDGKPTVTIYLDRLMVQFRVTDGVASGFNRKQQNMFAAALVHEIVHLGRGREWFDNRGNDLELSTQEEFRTYSIVDQNVVVPMLKMGEPLDEHHLEIHKILLDCNYQMPCQAFRDYTVDEK